MRIISGSFKGRRITAPKKLPVRPTTDMAKEGLFNILNNQFYFDDISVLDLFSGTGNISYEFASRGTSRITAVDADYGCIQFIEKTSEDFQMGIRPQKSDVFSFLEKTSFFPLAYSPYKKRPSDKVEQYFAPSLELQALWHSPK